MNKIVTNIYASLIKFVTLIKYILEINHTFLNYLKKLKEKLC